MARPLPSSVARVVSAQGKHDDALALLKVEEVGDFAPRLADTRGDILLAKGDRAGALDHYQRALPIRRRPFHDRRLQIGRLDAALAPEEVQRPLYAD